MSKSSSYNYTAADIERYYNGQMSPQEMHALEKAALDDPFLADALEGYVYTKTPAQDIQELKEKLCAKKERSRVIPFINYKNILRIAASFILIAGLGWATYQFAGLNKKEIAINTTDQKTQNAPAIVKPDTNNNNQIVIGNDLVNNDAASPKNETSNKKVEEPVVKKQKSNKTTEVGNGANDLNTQLSDVVQGVQTSVDTSNRIVETSIATTTAPANRAARNNLTTMLRGKVVDDKNTPVPFATITNKQNGISVQSDEKGNFKLPVKDSVVDVTVNSVGYQSARSFLNSEQDNVKITLKESDDKLSEVVVTAAPLTRRIENRFIVENAEPLKGWVTFNKYVIDQLNVPEEVDFKNVKGEVKISFDVGENGDAENVKVEKSLCAKCDEKAIQIIKEGTKWLKGKKKKKATARVKF